MHRRAATCYAAYILLNEDIDIRWFLLSLLLFETTLVVSDTRWHLLLPPLPLFVLSFLPLHAPHNRLQHYDLNLQMTTSAVSTIFLLLLVTGVPTLPGELCSRGSP